MYCSRCGTDAGGAHFCPNCGAQMPQQGPPPVTPQNQTPQFPPPPGSSSTSTLLIVVAGVLAGILMLVLAIGGFFLLRDDNSTRTADGDASQTPSPTTSASPSPSASQTPTKKPKRTPSTPSPGDVRDLPGGLFCRDLNARGYSYSAAVEYWRIHGQPNQMDADRNGIPCETVFPATDVSAYWGARHLPDDFTSGTVVEGLPAGLLCRDLYARGVSYPDAVNYYWLWGSPDRMDVDLNGIPCETVYSSFEINSFWNP